MGGGYAANCPAWAAFVRGNVVPRVGGGAVRVGGRTMKVIVLGEGWIESVSGSGNSTGVPVVETA